jgi:hypothetical protein
MSSLASPAGKLFTLLAELMTTEDRRLFSLAHERLWLEGIVIFSRHFQAH